MSEEIGTGSVQGETEANQRSREPDHHDVEQDVNAEDEADARPALSARQERAMVAMLACSSVAEAARQCGVSERTISRWMGQDKNFEARYRRARRDLFARNVRELQDNAPLVARELLKVVIAENTPATARVMAARALLEFSFRGAEFIHVTEQLEVTQEALAEAEQQKAGKH